MQAINLLRDDERRTQGPVRTPFLVRSVLALVGGLLVLAAIQWIVSERMSARDSQMAEREWSLIKTRNQTNEKLATRLGSAEAYRQELDSWNRARLDAVHLLHFVQETVPDAIQVIRLSWDDDFMTDDKAPGASKTNPKVSRALRMRLAGRVRGNNAQELVEGLISRISSYALPSDAGGGTNLFFSAVELRAFQAPSAPGTDPTAADLREFDIEARGTQRDFP
ncbi:MAG: hypothetical protein KBA51_00290 [Kiritimatiellae bacterium]|nr:hypothetical protein [Kiritimatiellia bacterium]